jgi:hypothetical protein
MARVLEVREIMHPLTIELGEDTYTGSGTIGGSGLVELEMGGRKVNREATFTIRKSVREAVIPLGSVVEVNGIKMIVRRYWGGDPVARAWTYWAETWI